MSGKAKTLEDITSTVFKQIFSKKVCLPSEYLKAFNQEVESKENIEEIISLEIIKDYEKSKQLLESSENLLKSSKEIVSSSVEVIASENKKEIEIIKNKLEDMLSHISSLTDELHRDELTKTFNRKWLFKEFLDDETHIKDKQGSVIFLDLNNFKTINDTFGHYTGDKALIYFANFLKKELEEKGFKDKSRIVRFAGDEFIVIVCDTDENKINEFFKDLKTLSEKRRLKDINTEETFKVSFSYGIKTFKQNDDFNELLKDADSSMYLMKSVREKK